MKSCIVRIGRGGLFDSKPLDIADAPDSVPFRGNAFLPAVAVIPLRQHSGVAARPVVQPGTPVREGQVIAVPKKANSAYVYSSIPGILRDYRTVPLADQTLEKAAVIELSGAFELSGKRSVPCELGNVTRGNLLKLAGELGLVRTFDSNCAPLVFLIRSFRNQFSKEVSDYDRSVGGILALRMYDFDPSCCVDSFLVKNYAGAVLEGCTLVAKILNVKRIFLSYPDKKAFAASDLTKQSLFDDFEVRRAAASGAYPSGAEHICKCEAAKAFGQSCPKNVFCINPWTAFSVFNALKFLRPVLQRPVLIAGSAIKSPQILNVRIGTRVRDLVEECGGFKFQPAKVVAGGLLAGKALHDLDTPVDMSTDALYFFGKDESRFYSVQRCIHCGRCLRICPCRLDPVRMASAVQDKKLLRGAASSSVKDTAAAVEDAVSKCIFCGACSAVCPAEIPLHHIINGTFDVSAERLGGQN